MSTEEAIGPGSTTEPATPKHHRNWRAIVLAPKGDGSIHRRGSDAFRLILAALVVVACELVVRVASSQETAVVHALTPAPSGIRWLVAVVWYAGSLGVITLVVVFALVTRNRRAARDVALAGLATWGLCGISVLLFGSTGGRPAAADIAGINMGFPLVRTAAAVAVAIAGLPYLSRGLRRLVGTLVLVAALATVVYGAGMPVAVIGSLALGYGVAAAVHLVIGSPTGVLSAEEITDVLAGIGVEASGLSERLPRAWGAARFHGRDQDGWLDVTVYGRDASDARLLVKVWRFILYRDSGPTLTVTRLQQVEHQAYLTLLAGRFGARAPDVVAARLAGSGRDAVLVTRPDTSERLADLEPDQVTDAAVDSVFESVSRLRAAGMAHGAITQRAVALAPGGDVAELVDFASASSSAPPERLDRDVAGALTAIALSVGSERALAGARRVLDTETVAAALVYLHPAALDRSMAPALRKHKALLKELREQGAAQAGIEVPKVAEARRVSWVNLIFALGTVVGAWALFGVLANVGQSMSTIVGARWGWVIGTFILSQAVYLGSGTELIGSVTQSIPFGRALLLEISNSFTTLAAGTMGALAARVRFFQQQGLPGTLAVSSGVLVSTASWIVKGGLFLIAIPFALGTVHFHKEGSSGSHTELVWLIVIIVIVVGVVLGLVLAVPRLRRVARDKLRPKLSDVVANFRELIHEPRKLVQIFGGCIAAQLFVALALGTALHAFNQHLSLATILVVLTLASMVGGVSPVPGGMGVVEAGMIFLLSSAGVPEHDAVAAVFVQRLFTAYLPPIWGWFVLAWMRRHEYL